MSTETSIPIPSFDLDGVAEYIQSGKATRILVMCGAGISVAAGIPDFRTPGTGLYSQVKRFNLPTPESLFTLSYLREHPEAFYSISNEMKLWPGTFAPTYVHHFIKLLSEKRLLYKCCTQNIDCLERSAGLKDDELIEAHGTFATASCIDCFYQPDVARLRAAAEAGVVPRCEACGGVLKPNVVFFGEPLPMPFITFLSEEASKADLLIVIGTSLKVFPFADLVDSVKPNVPRVVINNMRVGSSMFFKCDEVLTYEDSKTTSDSDDDTVLHKVIARAVSGRKATRDVFLDGDCQVLIKELAEKIGFGDELERRYQEGKKQIAESSLLKD